MAGSQHLFGNPTAGNQVPFGTPMAGYQYPFDTIKLDAAKAQDVGFFKQRLRHASTDPLKQMTAAAASTPMLITAVLCDTHIPKQMVFLADRVLCDAGSVKGHSTTFLALYNAYIGYDHCMSIGNLDDVDKCRIELGYAIHACLGLFPRCTLEKVVVEFSEYVKEKEMKRIQSMIDVAQHGHIGTEMPPREPPAEVKRPKYIQEMDNEGLKELLACLELSSAHISAVKKEALSAMAKKAFA